MLLQQYFPYFVCFPFSCLFVWFPFFAKPGEIAPKKEQTSESKKKSISAFSGIQPKPTACAQNKLECLDQKNIYFSFFSSFLFFHIVQWFHFQ
jgi:hypothetical protein